VLLEFLQDDALQAAVQHQLSLPEGRWREVPHYGCAHELPVTYKFNSRPGDAFRGKHSSFTIGDVLAAAKADLLPSGAGCLEGPEVYRRTLQNVPNERLKAWGIAFKENDFRAFRFPACADRVIYWATDALSSRLSWSVLRDGYEVNHLERGSDHRPVSLEAMLRIASQPVIAEDQVKASVNCDQALVAALAKEVCQSDSEGSDAGEAEGSLHREVHKEAPMGSFWSSVGRSFGGRW